MKLQLKRSNVIDGSGAKKPSPDQMDYGELAVNYNDQDPALFIKDSNNDIRQIGADVENYYTKDEIDASQLWTLNGSNLYPTTITNNVGIGKTNPGYPLDVSSSDNTFIRVRSETDNAKVTGILFGDSSSAAPAGVKYNHAGNFMSFTVDEKTDVIIRDGNIGVGRSDPQEALSLLKDDGPLISLETNNVRKWTVGLKGTTDNKDFAIKDGTDSSTALYIKHDTQYVGIGTTAPTQLLEVSGETPAIAVTKPNGGQLKLVPATDANGSMIRFGGLETGGVQPRILRFVTVDDEERARFDEQGKFGIGTTDPQTALHVVGDVTIENLTNAASIAVDANGKLIPGTGGGGGAWTDDGSGNLYPNELTNKVGIGTDAPEYTLDVAGDFKATNYRIDLLEELS